jgi:hypothetical protein
MHFLANFKNNSEKKFSNNGGLIPILVLILRNSELRNSELLNSELRNNELQNSEMWNSELRNSELRHAVDYSERAVAE